jgi:hypothetical protein
METKTLKKNNKDEVCHSCPQMNGVGRNTGKTKEGDKNIKV